eukprot:TRINITY_DN2541_c0_g1_i1.p2 TRINITY_DN2541_c0_g1~~TRINITY_DN2541_c0_g1_i1.p2  ORF type:complete len:138 (+),score=13.29 TRINITY_DN2541_c0_g1_i1:586-999(+)
MTEEKFVVVSIATNKSKKLLVPTTNAHWRVPVDHKPNFVCPEHLSELGGKHNNFRKKSTLFFRLEHHRTTDSAHDNIRSIRSFATTFRNLNEPQKNIKKTKKNQQLENKTTTVLFSPSSARSSRGFTPSLGTTSFFS